MAGPADDESAGPPVALPDEPEPAELDATVGTPSETESRGASPEFMSAAEAKLAEANERYVRLAADFENYRKRAAKEKADVAAAAGEGLLAEVLPVVDNLERALAAAREGKANAHGFASVVKGVELTLKMFQGILGRCGVERIAAAGEKFDPWRHEAIAQEEREGVAEETVLEELEPGYLVRGRVLRPAKVKVARPKPPAAAADSSGGTHG